jgi:glycerol-3-phosphate dehydrogenase
MRRDLGALDATEFDLAVIGGGITGALVAHDATLRGLKVALLEKGDFGGATSAASSKVLHSGIRYLQRLELGKLRESAIERSAFQRIAPHLTHYIPFLIPTYPGLAKGRAALWTAIQIHDALSGGSRGAIADPAKRPPPSRICSRDETIALAPILGDHGRLTGACLVHESHMHSSERMTLAFVKTAAANGAVVANYAAAVNVLTSGGAVSGVTVRDELTGGSFDVRARLVVNAAGPWISTLGRQFGLTPAAKRITAFSKGAHLVTRSLTSGVALVMPTAKKQVSIVDRGGRHLFVIPWRDRSLIGTSNVPFNGDPDEVGVTGRDIADFLSDVNGALPGAGLTRDDVEHAFAGLYPLTVDALRPEVYQATGTYHIIDHGRLGEHDAVVSVLGARYTTARRLAERAVNLVLHKLKRPVQPSTTATTPLVGGRIDHLPAFVEAAVSRHGPRLGADAVRHLVEHYGTEIDEVLAVQVHGLNPDAKLSPSRECIEAEVAYAAVAEMAQHLEDVVLRRTGLGTIGHPGLESLVRCADIMAAALGWSDARRREEVERTDRLLSLPEVGAA